MQRYKTLIIRLFTVIVIGFTGLVTAAETAKSCKAESGHQTVALLELYTSEGCSSCPPADRWLSKLGKYRFNPKQLIPLSLHVDYWNYLGWRDPFSQPVFTRRQKQLARINRSSAIYTPQFVLAGRDFRHWYARPTLARQIKDINARSPQAKIYLTLNKIDHDHLRVTIRIQLSDQTRVKTAGGYLVLYENNLSNQVAAGENHGRRLNHDFVVRKMIGPVFFKNGKLNFSQVFKLMHGWKTRDLGIVGFVQDQKNGDVLQALALPLCQGRKRK